MTMTMTTRKRDRKIWTPQETRGRQLLLKLVAGGKTQTAIAAEFKGYGLRATQGCVSHWANGRNRPDALFRRVLQALYGIPEDEWLTEEEHAVVAALPGRAAHEAEDLLEWRPIHSKKTTKN